MDVNSKREHTVIVGASVAGARTAAHLHALGYKGRITLIGDEAHFPPFERPTLSKELLTRDRSIDRCRLPLGTLDARMMLGRIAIALDLANRTITLDDGAHIGFDVLVIATGTVPRLLPVGEPVGGVFALRTADDALALRDSLTSRSRVTIAGAGFIGCEVASSCRHLGAAVNVIEPARHPMASAVGPAAGEYIAQLHRAHGVTMTFDRRVVGVKSSAHLGRLAPGVDDRQVVHDVVDSEGTHIPTDVFIHAVGVQPSVEWLSGTPLDINDGVLCDSRCRAINADRVYAVGDICRWDSALMRGPTRIEHWVNAASQARYVAAQIAGTASDGPYDFMPYFWSRQYGKTFQSLGTLSKSEEVIDYHLSSDDDGRVFTYRDGPHLIGALVVDRPEVVPKYRRLIAESALEMSKSIVPSRRRQDSVAGGRQAHSD